MSRLGAFKGRNTIVDKSSLTLAAGYEVCFSNPGVDSFCDVALR